mmetsp:Transcript_101099/g.159389  ORF Transcript_101099/g.159389 Transcript_101099/m.159389 type:complete len:227 (-) Transcript_101099:321-1001(-)
MPMSSSPSFKRSLWDSLKNEPRFCMDSRDTLAARRIASTAAAVGLHPRPHSSKNAVCTALSTSALALDSHVELAEEILSKSWKPLTSSSGLSARLSTSHLPTSASMNTSGANVPRFSLSRASSPRSTRLPSPSVATERSHGQTGRKLGIGVVSKGRPGRLSCCNGVKRVPTALVGAPRQMLPNCAELREATGNRNSVCVSNLGNSLPKGSNCGKCLPCGNAPTPRA